MTKREKLLALIPALWTSLFDTIITIKGQFKEYGFWSIIAFILFNSILFYVIDDKISKNNWHN